jgi:hypothetical protein
MQCGGVSCEKRARMLSENEIREIVMDLDSDEDKYYDSATEDQEPRPPSTLRSPSPDYFVSSSEDEVNVGNVTGQQPQPSQRTLHSKPRRRVVQNFTGPPNGKSREAAHITPEPTPLTVLLLFFAEIVILLVVETNRYYHQFLDNCEDGPSLQRDVTEPEMFAFLALTLQMGHTVQDRLQDYWMKLQQLCTPFYGQAIARARFCHILRFLHFTDNIRNGDDRADDRLWKIRDI